MRTMAAYYIYPLITIRTRPNLCCIHTILDIRHTTYIHTIFTIGTVKYAITIFTGSYKICIIAVKRTGSFTQCSFWDSECKLIKLIKETTIKIKL